MNLTELKKLAEAAWIGDDEDAQIELQYQGEAISRMIELMEEMAGALDGCLYPQEKQKEAIAKYNKERG